MYPSNNLIYIPMTQSVIVANGLFSKTYKMYNVNIVERERERESSHYPLNHVLWYCYQSVQDYGEVTITFFCLT